MKSKALKCLLLVVILLLVGFLLAGQKSCLAYKMGMQPHSRILFSNKNIITYMVHREYSKMNLNDSWELCHIYGFETEKRPSNTHACFSYLHHTGLHYMRKLRKRILKSRIHTDLGRSRVFPRVSIWKMGNPENFKVINVIFSPLHSDTCSELLSCLSLVVSWQL